MKIGKNAIKVLERRYLLKNDKGLVIETPSKLFRRVAHAIASVETKYNQNVKVKKIEDQFYKIMSHARTSTARHGIVFYEKVASSIDEAR